MIMTVVWAVIFTLDTILAALALRGRYILLLEMVTPALTLILGYASITSIRTTSAGGLACPPKTLPN